MAAEQGIVPVTERIVDPTERDLEQLEPIYVAGFPASEREPFEDIVRAIRSGSLLFLAAREGEGGSIVGFMLLVPSLPGTNAAYLPYFAVDSHKRGQGAGSEIFRFMVCYLTENSPANALVWEVEAENPDDPNDLPNRRIRFYQRLGGKVVEQAAGYVMPNFEGGIIPARLMWIPLGQRQPKPDKSEITGWVRAIFAIGYPDHLDLGEQIIAAIQ